MSLYHGSCHCGALRFTVDAEIADLYTCDCSLCRRRGATMTSVHESRLKITSGEDKLTLYQWNARIARHYFCVVCGIYPFHKKRSMPDHYGVNTACLEDFDPAGMAVRKAEGLGMSVVASDPRPQWTGPRTP
ncbi:MAG: GFA family protein [Alphaproteobacteria bacterium]